MADMDKILITGGSGLLGSATAKLARAQFEVYAAYHKHKVNLDGVHCFALDLSQKEALDKITAIGPACVIHCAALTNVDYCEENPKEAYAHNVTASRNVARAAKETGAYLIHISTDGVFDGERGNYKEEDATNPVNVYGQTKLEAEQEVASVDPKACIVRTNMYGWNALKKFSLAEWMIDKLEAGSELPGFQDVWFSPLFTNDLAEIFFELYKIKHAGILHVGSPEACTKLDFAYKVAEVFGYDPSVIKPVHYRDVGLKAPRGLNASLNVSKAQALLSRALPDITSGLKKMKQLRESHCADSAKNG